VDLDARLVAWVALSALLIATPGPDTALIIRNALTAGPRASTMSALGVAAGTLVWVTASAVGVGLLLERSSTAFTIVKLAGAWAPHLVGSSRRAQRAPRVRGGS
jgi:threonine/homoserine/homoserine lactone efflux protein